MTPQVFINQNSGKRIGDGQCGALIDLWLVEGYGVHTEYATALDYWTNGIAAFEVAFSPRGGDIACYNAHPGFPDGHIAMYAGSGQVFEQNADPDGSPAHLFARANTYLLGYLTKGETDMLSEDQFYECFRAMLGRDPTQQEASTLTRQAGSLVDTLWNNGGEQNYENVKNGSSETVNVVVNGKIYVPQG